MKTKQTNDSNSNLEYFIDVTPNQLMELFNTLYMLVLVLDIKQQIIYANSLFLKFLQADADFLYGKTFTEIFPSLLNDLTFYREDNALEPAPLPSGFITEYTRPNRQKAYLQWNTTPVKGTNGNTHLTFCFGEDITAARKKEDDLRTQIQTLERHIDDRTIELEALYAVASIANEPLSLPQMLEKVLNKTILTIGMPYGAIHLFNDDETELNLVAQVGISEDVIKRIDCITPGFGLPGWTSNRKQPLALTHVSSDPRILSIGQVSGYSQYLNAPINTFTRIWGVISVFGNTSRTLNPERVALLTTIADQLGITLERFELRQKAEEKVVMEERQRMARELHDSVTQSLYSLTLLAAAGHRSIQDGSFERALRNLDRVGSVAFQTLKQMRLLVYELQPSILAENGYSDAVRQRLNAVEEHAGMQTLFIDECPITLPQPIQVELYGLTQEALNNSIKHSNANSVNVHLYGTDKLIVLEIQDNGEGFDPQQVRQKHGSGFTSMEQRAKQLNGRLDIQSTPGQGTCVTIRFPQDNISMFNHNKGSNG